MTTTPSRNRFPLLIWIALPATLAAALVMVLRSPRPAETVTAAAPPASTDEVAQLRDELKLVRRQLQVVSQQQSAAAPGKTESTAPTAPPLTEEQVSERDRRRFEGLARKLAAEPVDRSWAPQTERLIADALKKPVFKGTKLVGATCHSTLCRFEVLHDSESDRRRFSSALPTRLPSLPSGSMRNAEGSERKTIVYVAREGHRVPRDDPQ